MTDTESQRSPDGFEGAVITIDGPAGSGKSTTARLLAERIGFDYLDTGAMYRAAAWFADQIGTNLEDDNQVQDMLARLDLRLESGAEGMRVFCGAEDITAAIRTPQIDLLVSSVAAQPTIRQHMAKWQRERAANGNVVLEGRDTGTVVCPEAEVKIYLDASLAQRAGRRLAQRGNPVDEDSLQTESAEITRRDRADTERKHSPLKLPVDAVIVDTSELTIEGQIEAVLRACSERLSREGA